jgi:nucleoside-diphosphate-sugar epimerase
MAPRIFILGTTGFIGGHATAVISREHPEWKLVSLIRDPEKAKQVKAALPEIEIVLGDLDSHDILVEEAYKADVVLNTAHADHHAGTKSIVEGIARKENKGYYIHTSGTAILAETPNGYGVEGGPSYSDVKDIAKILSFDKSRYHREIDEIVLQAGQQGLKTAIVCPPTIYGIGKGPVNIRSQQIPILIKQSLKRGKVFQIEKGTNSWSSIHVSDLAQAYQLLIEQALEPDGGKATWGEEGYYFVESGVFVCLQPAQLYMIRLQTDTRI